MGTLNGNIGAFTINKHLSGGIEIKMASTGGTAVTVLAPQDAVNAAVHIFKLCGINVEFKSAGPIIKPVPSKPILVSG